MNFLVAFTIAGTAIGLIRALPQLFRLIRTRDAHGVSLDAAATSSIVSTAWTAYGVLTAQPAIVLASGASAVMFALVTAAALRYGRTSRELRAAPVWAVVLLIAGVLWGALGLSFVLPVSVLVANVPQLWVALRESDLSGLSLGTWVLSFVEALVWGGYAIAGGDRAILVHSGLYVATSGGIVALRLAKRSPPHAARD